MTIHELKDASVKVMDLYTKLCITFHDGEDTAAFFHIAIMAGLKDAYDKGYKKCKENELKQKKGI